ncbi:MAG: bifunctional demethylmenaquinone methyltransferase/2-methoxy-6-polyprenyl-1,4-benzoquinol methylase UbiE [Bacteroidaceae bacterium]|nr:bifunctional demethylmenaquinone methyltransferase/2-methoxy-6-polyprenyl-1,4-benzoquinol methylase UbiE [Bacteroidaceae bacterium]
MYDQEQVKPYSQSKAKTEQVTQMFDHIAPTYDRLNHTLSFGIDRRWRKKAICALKPYRPMRLLDIATGTGDFALLAYRLLRPETIIGVDISEGMMAVGREKIEAAGLSHCISFQNEDCCKGMSFPANSMDAITIAFGARNFEHLDDGLREMYRVLKPQQPLVLLELSTPKCFPMKQLFWLYAHVVMPTIGRLISRDESAYTYLPASMAAFPQAETMQGIMKKAGFSEVRYERLTFGICTLYVAIK